MARILIVDDEAHIRTLLRRFLERDGHECALATSADEAWAMLQTAPFELVLSDVNMPGTSGLELAPRIAEAYPDTPVVMVTGVDDPEVATRAVEAGAYGYIIKPFVPNEIIIGVAGALRRRELEISNRRHQHELEALVAERTAEVHSTLAQLQEANELLKAVQEEIIQRLSIASEYRDEETGAHIHRISHYTKLLTVRIGQDEGYVERIRLASPLHDVGKIATPDAILRKPGKHTPEEWEIMKGHSEAGYRILAGSGFPVLDMAAEIAISHHEKWDGTGYPHGLKGEKIPLCGRLTAVADVFDALSTERVYKPAFSIEKSVGIIRDGRGTHLDPEVVDVFLESLDDVVEIKRNFPDGGVYHL
jgi:putative two-component system response regulator